MKKGNTTKLFVTVLAASIFLTGCQSADVDYNLNESQEEGQETEQDSLSTLAQFSNLEPWNETFTIKTPEGKDFTVQIDAEIEVKPTDNMSVIEVEILGEEDITYDFGEEMAYPVTRYTGLLPNEWYDLDAEPTTLENIYYLPDDINSRREGYTHAKYFALSEWSLTGEESTAIKEKNSCSMSQEEAEAVAQEFILKAGFSMYQRVDTSDLLWYYSSGDEEDCYIKDGYMVTFELADDMGILMGENEGDYKEFMDLRSDRILSLNVCVDVYVADEGVFDLRIENPVRVVNTTKISSFLSFDAIKNILRNSFEENLKKTYVISDAFANTQEKLYINSIELIYFRVKNPEKEGIYSYIPAWRFCRRMKVGGNEEKVIYSPVIINAIDGTVIDLKEQW